MIPPITLTALMPDPALTGFRLEHGRLNVDHLTTATTNPAAARDLTPALTRLEFDRGVAADPLQPNGELGTLTATFHNPPAWPDLRPGVQLTLTAARAGVTEPLFLADVVTVSRQWSKLGDTETLTVTAVDRTAKLTRARIPARLTTTEVPSLAEVPESWGARITAVAAAAGVAHLAPHTQGIANTAAGGTTDTLPADELLDLTAAAVGALWWVDSSGRLRGADANYSTGATLALTDAARDSSYTGITLDHNGDDLVNVLTTEQAAVSLADPAKPETVTTRATVRDVGSVALYGEQALTLAHVRAVDSTGPIAAGVTRPPAEVAGYWFGHTVRDLRARPATVTLTDPPALEQFHRLDLTYRGTTYPCVVLARHDQITAAEWVTTLTLANRKDT